ncbi:DUF4367 domain-containing protein [Gracilibacillus salitolerans]|uniref:DUF4367 domain-containing protein n=1 Tax=Gracilibacillus salitolerans TaxID=2663022 RepID=A0A5Q2THW0_9BACI|nr:DUF4367 domain-containing protein [Gracilibacillus salitolerans]QGH32998.1 DUF4367 domain-containing protein [Gracilibacillus salitolerans]
MCEEHKWKEWLKEDYHKVEDDPRSKDENWEKIIKQVSQTNQHQKKMPKKSLLAVAMIAVIVIGSAFVQSDQMQAFDWFVKMFVTTDGNTTQINQTTTEEKDPATESLPDFDNITTEEVQEESKEMTFEEAQADTEFYISKPSYLPNSYQLDLVTVFYEKSSAKDVQLDYINDRNDVLTLHLTYQPNDFADAKVVDNEDTEIKTIALGDGEARLIAFKDGVSQIIWSTPQMNWLLEGTEKEKNLIKIAESIE